MACVVVLAVVIVAVIGEIGYSIYLWGFGNGLDKCHRMWLDNLEAAERNLAAEDNDA